MGVNTVGVNTVGVNTVGVNTVGLIDDISAALGRNLAARGGAPTITAALTPALTAAEAEERLFGLVYKQPGMPTKADCIQAVERVREEFGHWEATCLLQRFGVEKLSDLWIGSYVEFVGFANRTIEYGKPPSWSWIDGKPAEIMEGL